MKSTFTAFGILAVYGFSNIYLVRTFDTQNLLLKTAFSLIYFFVWIIPLVYLWRKGKVRESIIAPILVLCLALLYTSSLTAIKVPIEYAYPDVAFHAAKVLLGSDGQFFYDPVTSFPSIYPSVYHILLGWLMRLFSLDNSFYLLSRVHILLFIVLFLSVYLLANSMFNPRTALVSVFFIGAIFDMPSQNSMFYPTPFFMGLIVIVNSITLVYLSLQGKPWCLYPAGLLTGLAVTIWPAFLPVAFVLALVIFFAPGKEVRRPVDLIKFAIPFLGIAALVWIPQYLLLAKHHLWGHHSIARLKGIPELGWFPDFVSRFILLGGIDPDQLWVTVVFGISYVILISTAVLGFRYLKKEELGKRRFLTMHLLLIPAVLILVDYILGPTFSRRAQLVFSILLVTVTAHYLVEQLNKKYRILSISFIVGLVVLTCGWKVYNLNKALQTTRDRYEREEKLARGVLQFIESNTDYGEYIFATAPVYRLVIMGNLIRFALVAHRDGTYFSLNPDLSKRMLNDYWAVLESNDFGFIKNVLNRYHIKYILIYEREKEMFYGMRQLFYNCIPVYQDSNFTVLKFQP